MSGSVVGVLGTLGGYLGSCAEYRQQELLPQEITTDQQDLSQTEAAIQHPGPHANLDQLRAQAQADQSNITALTAQLKELPPVNGEVVAGLTVAGAIGSVALFVGGIFIARRHQRIHSSQGTPTLESEESAEDTPADAPVEAVNDAVIETSEE